MNQLVLWATAMVHLTFVHSSHSYVVFHHNSLPRKKVYTCIKAEYPKFRGSRWIATPTIELVQTGPSLILTSPPRHPRWKRPQKKIRLQKFIRSMSNDGVFKSKIRKFWFYSPTPKNCIVLYCINLYCIILYCSALYCIILSCIVLHCIVLYRIVLYHIALYCIVLYCIVLYCTVLYCIVSYCSALYCTVLYRITLYCIALYCIVLYRIVLSCKVYRF